MHLTERVPQNTRCGAALPLSHRLALFPRRLLQTPGLVSAFLSPELRAMRPFALVEMARQIKEVDTIVF